MRLYGALLALILAGSACRAQSAEDRFSADMLARLRAALPGTTLTIKPGDPFALKTEGGSWREGEINFGRIYGYCQTAAAEACETAKADFVRRLPKTVPAGPAPADLRLIVRDRQYWNYLQGLPQSKDGDFAVGEPLGADLYVILAADSPDTIALVGQRGLKELHMSRDEAWALALRQTKAALPALPTPAQFAKGPVMYEGHDYGASLLVDRAGWARLAGEMGPDLFVTVVSDKFVFVGTMPDGPRLDAFKQTVADDCTQQERCVSPNIYRFRNGNWAIAR
jgi:hypothetical protein